MGLSGPVPARVDATTKTGLLGLIDEAVTAGWPVRRACRELDLGEVRAHRWRARRGLGRLADTAPGGSPMHGLLPEEVEEILALFEAWGETDRSHRKLAHRGSYLGRFWVSPSSVRRVCFTCTTSTSGLCHGRGGLGGGRSRTGSSTPRTRSGSTTRLTSRPPGWLCSSSRT